MDLWIGLTKKFLFICSDTYIQNTSLCRAAWRLRGRPFPQSKQNPIQWITQYMALHLDNASSCTSRTLESNFFSSGQASGILKLPSRILNEPSGWWSFTDHGLSSVHAKLGFNTLKMKLFTLDGLGADCHELFPSHCRIPRAFVGAQCRH